MTRLLSESITHIEDLSVDEFIDVLRNLSTMTAQEKLDGANLWAGLDDQGKFFTSREGKRNNAERRYEESDWPKVAAFDQFRAAHLALQAKEGEIKLVLRNGDTVEVEVLYGKQPNSVTYGADNLSYIAFLRGVNGTPDEMADQLGTTLNNQQAVVKFDAVNTEDGKDLSMDSATVTFRFTTPQTIDPSNLKNASGIDSELAKLEVFLRHASPIEGLSNHQLATAQLGSIPKDQREEVKAARAQVLATIQSAFKLPIKNALLDKVVRKLRSGLSDPNTPDEENIGIEGIVLRDPRSGKQVKVVDKDVFTAVNKFNQSARGEVQSGLMTTDPDAPLESRGGIVGELRIKIADALGNREMAKPANLRKILEPIKGGSPEEAIKNLAASLNIEDPQALRKRVLALVAETAKQLDERLEAFKQNKSMYRLKLKNGKEMGLSDDTVKKTLLTFAEARRNLSELFEKIKGTKTVAQLLATLYGGQARAMHVQHDTEPVQESLLESKGEVDLNSVTGKDLFHILNSYFATVFLAMFIYHTNDKIGMRLLRDRKNYMLKKHSPDMSPLNHWGYVVWKSNKPDVKKHVKEDVLKKLAEITKHIPKPWAKFLHMDFSLDKEVTVDWSDHKRTLQRLIELSGLRSERLNTLLDQSVKFEDLDLEDQKKYAKKVNAFAHTFVPRSALYTRARVIERELKDAKEKMVSEGTLLKSIAALVEDDGGAAPAPDSGGGVPATGTATTASAVANQPVRLLDTRRRTEKRKRNPEVKDLTIKFPDPRKEKKA